LLKYSPTLRFIVVGAMSYTVVSFQGSLMSLRFFNEPFHFTHHTIAHAHLGLYAFFTMVMFGCMYYMVPRLTGREWSSSLLIRIHFWSVVTGMAIYFAGLTLGGAVQGFELNQSSVSLTMAIREHGFFFGIRQWFSGFAAQNGAVPFMEIVRGTVPWLTSRSVAGLLMTVGHVVFFILVFKNVHAWGRQRRSGKPTLFVEDTDEYERLAAGETQSGSGFGNRQTDASSGATR
jgi:cytochrome c oxidase cbb3-type subunit 1